MKFKKKKDEGNPWGWDVVEILHFNYDGKGGAIVKYNDNLDSIGLVDLNGIMFGSLIQVKNITSSWIEFNLS